MVFFLFLGGGVLLGEGGNVFNITCVENGKIFYIRGVAGEALRNELGVVVCIDIPIDNW